MLLGEKSTGLDVNKEICLADGMQWSPIERAAALRSIQMVKTLLLHHADPNRRLAKYSFESSMLSYAIALYEPRPGITRIQVDSKLFLLLFRAGAKLDVGSLINLLHSGNGQLAILYLSERASKEDSALWYAHGIAKAAILGLREPLAFKFVEKLVEFGTNEELNASHHSFDHDLPSGVGWSGDHVIDAACRRGYIDTVKYIFQHGALLTDDALPNAVESGCEELVRFLVIEAGASVFALTKERAHRYPLAVAVRSRETTIKQFLLDQGALTHCRYANDLQRVLEAAAEVGDSEIAHIIIRHETKIDAYDLGIALSVAVRRGYHVVSTMLLDAGASAEGANVPTTALEDACKRHDLPLVIMLLEAGSDPNESTNHIAEVPLSLAVQWGESRAIDGLIEAGASLDALQDEDSPLTCAILQQGYDLVWSLIRAGADPSAPRSKGLNDSRTPLAVACELNDTNIAKLLLENGADPQNTAASSNAASFENYTILDLIFERHAKIYPNRKKSFAAAALIQTVKSRERPLFEYLLHKGADCSVLVRIRDFDRCLWSPFGYAISKTGEEDFIFVELLLGASGCTPNDIVALYNGERRETALLAAIYAHNLPVVQLLLKFGADSNAPARGRVRRTPLQAAAEAGTYAIVELLLGHGADVNAPAAHIYGGTALQLAAKKGYAALVCFLLEYHANVDARGSVREDKTALESAAEFGRLDIARILLNAGAGSTSETQRRILHAADLAESNGHFPLAGYLRDYHLNRASERLLANAVRDNTI